MSGRRWVEEGKEKRAGCDLNSRWSGGGEGRKEVEVEVGEVDGKERKRKVSIRVEGQAEEITRFLTWRFAPSPLLFSNTNSFRLPLLSFQK
jgi:hypothetical protein